MPWAFIVASTIDNPIPLPPYSCLLYTSGLACGKPIRGNVAFLGGPLHFLTELKEAFIRTLNLKDDEIIAPTHSHLFAAVGAALNAKEEVTTDFEHLLKQFE